MNQTPIYIIGASGLGQEVACYILDAGLKIQAFVDAQPKENIQIREQTYLVLPENDFLATIQIDQKPHVVIAIGFPNIKQQVVEKFIGKCLFPNIIHPSALLLDNIVIGMGNIIGPNTVITRCTRLGNFNFFNIGVSIGHDVKIGDFNVFNPKVSISGNVFIGNLNLFGVNSSVIQNIRIGNNNVIGIGSALIKKNGDDTVQIGVPSKNIK